MARAMRKMRKKQKTREESSTYERSVVVVLLSLTPLFSRSRLHLAVIGSFGLLLNGVTPTRHSKYLVVIVASRTNGSGVAHTHSQQQEYLVLIVSSGRYGSGLAHSHSKKYEEVPKFNVGRCHRVCEEAKSILLHTCILFEIRGTLWHIETFDVAIGSKMELPRSQALKGYSIRSFTRCYSIRASFAS